MRTDEGIEAHRRADCVPCARSRSERRPPTSVGSSGSAKRCSTSGKRILAHLGVSELRKLRSHRPTSWAGPRADRAHGTVEQAAVDFSRADCGNQPHAPGGNVSGCRRHTGLVLQERARPVTLPLRRLTLTWLKRRAFNLRFDLRPNTKEQRRSPWG